MLSGQTLPSSHVKIMAFRPLILALDGLREKIAVWPISVISLAMVPSYFVSAFR